MSYDDAKAEALRMLDDDRWRFSIWEAAQYRKTRWLFFAYTCQFVIGFVIVDAAWPRLMLGTGMIVVLFAYLRFYGNGNKNPIARLRGLLRRGL